MTTEYGVATFGGRDDSGDIVPDGTYTITLTAKTGDGKCTARSEIDITVQSECRVTISTDPKEVWPKNAGSNNKITADVLVTLQRPAPLGGCAIDFEVEPVEDSGGHKNHSGDRPKGEVKDSSITIPTGTEGTVKVAVYTSNEVSGEETIIAKMKGKEIDKTTITVRVPNLTTLGDGENYDLKASTSIHPNSYNAAVNVRDKFISIANAYAVAFPNDPRLVVTDISLPKGGMFDLCGTYNPGDTCAAAPKGGHSGHRAGRNVDVRKWNIPERNRIKFSELCLNYNAAAGDHGDHYHLTFK